MLLAEDNEGDVLLVREVLKRLAHSVQFIVAEDGDKMRSLFSRFGRDLPLPDNFADGFKFAARRRTGADRSGQESRRLPRCALDHRQLVRFAAGPRTGYSVSGRALLPQTFEF